MNNIVKSTPQPAFKTRKLDLTDDDEVWSWTQGRMEELIENIVGYIDRLARLPAENPVYPGDTMDAEIVLFVDYLDELLGSTRQLPPILKVFRKRLIEWDIRFDVERNNLSQEVLRETLIHYGINPDEGAA